MFKKKNLNFQVLYVGPILAFLLIIWSPYTYFSITVQGIVFLLSKYSAAAS